MSGERFLDELARTLAEPMPRRRAARVIGASLVAVAVPGVSPRIARAGLATPRRGGATCPDGSECGAGESCCDEPNVRGVYNCRRPGQVCCCGNAICNPPKERCWCPSREAGGVCAPNCPLVYGRGFKNCGAVCCQPHQRCADELQGTCVSCEQEGKQTCRSYDSKSSVRCCPATRTPGATSSCCANMTSTACCGEEQTCKATRGPARCVCAAGTKCELECCKRGHVCCDGKCCPKGQVCVAKIELVDEFFQMTRTCRRRCNGTACGVGHCCGSGTKCQRGACVRR